MDQPFTNGDPITAQPTQIPSPTPDYSNPSHSDLAAVAATVSVVGVLMTALVTWLILRLRRAESRTDHLPISRRPASNAYIVRPSFAPSDASSRFGFIRKPLRLSRRHESDSWDFADPDPFHARPKEGIFDTPPDAAARAPKDRPAPLKPVPPYTPPSPRAHRASTYKDELRTPTTPGTPASMELVEPPPPAYCRDGFSSSFQPMTKDRSPP